MLLICAVIWVGVAVTVGVENIVMICLIVTWLVLVVIGAPKSIPRMWTPTPVLLCHKPTHHYKIVSGVNVALVLSICSVL